MGFYINPRNGQTKEEWLDDRSAPTLSAPSVHADETHVAVCLVDNGMFTAAGICVDGYELQSFAHPDGRPKLWFWVPKADVAEFLHGQEIA